MGIGEQLSAAALKQENMGLRAELARARGMLMAISAQDRAMAMEARFIAAALQTQAVSVSCQQDRSERIGACISIGRETARLYIEQLAAEAEMVAAEVPAPEGGLVVVPGTGDEN